MPITVCLSATQTFNYPEGGGHLWVYLNWALGLKALGCRVIWLECVSPRADVETTLALARGLKDRLARFGLGDSLAIHPMAPCPIAGPLGREFPGLGDAAERADLLLNQRYDLPEEIVREFRRSCLLDIDPGLLQHWVSAGELRLAPHDLYFTIGETVGRPGSLFPDCGLRWHYTPPCIALDHWPVRSAPSDAHFTTISHWEAREWIVFRGKPYRNDKRTGFLPYLDLPRHTDQPLELALCFQESDADRELLRELGWSTRHAWEVSATPERYREYIGGSLGEFSCVKPSCVLLQNAWISDRTLCYLASGKPAVVEHTGSSRFLPDADGLFRFRDRVEAVRALETIAADYDRQCHRARGLAEEFFDARKVTGHLLEKAFA